MRRLTGILVLAGLLGAVGAVLGEDGAPEKTSLVDLLKILADPKNVQRSTRIVMSKQSFEKYKSEIQNYSYDDYKKGRSHEGDVSWLSLGIHGTWDESTFNQHKSQLVTRLETAKFHQASVEIEIHDADPNVLQAIVSIATTALQVEAAAARPGLSLVARRRGPNSPHFELELRFNDIFRKSQTIDAVLSGNGVAFTQTNVSLQDQGTVVVGATLELGRRARVRLSAPLLKDVVSVALEASEIKTVQAQKPAAQNEIPETNSCDFKFTKVPTDCRASQTIRGQLALTITGNTYVDTPTVRADWSKIPLECEVEVFYTTANGKRERKILVEKQTVTVVHADQGPPWLQTPGVITIDSTAIGPGLDVERVTLRILKIEDATGRHFATVQVDQAGTNLTLEYVAACR